LHPASEVMLAAFVIASVPALVVEELRSDS
jgi:hypothetical protein